MIHNSETWYTPITIFVGITIRVIGLQNTKLYGNIMEAEIILDA